MPEQAPVTFTVLRGTPAQVKWAGSLRAQCYSRLITRFGVAHRLSLLGAVNRYRESWEWIDQHKGIESVIAEEMLAAGVPVPAVPASEQQVASIRKLCSLVGRDEPQEALGYSEAKEMIAELSREYREKREKEYAAREHR